MRGREGKEKKMIHRIVRDIAIRYFSKLSQFGKKKTEKGARTFLDKNMLVATHTTS